MKKTKIIYWTLNGLFAAFMFFTAIPDILSSADAVKFIGDLGYPAYFIPFIGVAKALGSIAIIIPGYNTIKEWAYAGLMFDLIAAFYSIAATTGIVSATPLILFIAFAVAAYFFHHKKLKEESLISK